MSVKTKFYIGAILAFISVISFFNISSFWADTHNTNGLLTGVGIAFGIAAIGFIVSGISSSKG